MKTMENVAIIINYSLTLFFLAYCLQGRRPTMEDRFVMTESLPPIIDQKLMETKDLETSKDLQRRQSIKIYGVFDGHGGEVNLL